MGRVQRRLVLAFRGLLVLVVLAAIGLVGARLYLGRSMQPRSGEVTLPGLAAPATAAFDEWAVPRITADSYLDVFRVQGFVHASERLWQMELVQRITRGTLAEVFGEAALETDRLVRTLDLWGATEAEVAILEQDTRSVVEAYAEGVNARIATWDGPWPPEFVILGIEPQSWSPTASLAVARLMALDLTGWSGELESIVSLQELPDDRRELLRPWHPSWDPTIIQQPITERLWVRDDAGDWDPPANTVSAGNPSTGMGVSEADVGSAPGPLDPLSLLTSVGWNGSNSWALGPDRTADGHALLAGDTHLGLRAPSTWYLNALRAEDGSVDIAGLSVPGAPGIVIGLNRDVAWTFTNGMIDDADFVIERVSEDGTEYLHKGAWHELGTRVEEIAVSGRAPDTLVVRATHRGPIITDVLPAADLTLSLKWTGLDPIGPLGGVVAINQARTAEEVDAAAKLFASPHQNLIYATGRGRIGFQLVGALPDRIDGGVGAVALDGEASDTWNDYLPSDSAPALTDPASGYLASANNLQAPDAYGRIAVNYPIPDRARRVDEVVSRAEGWTVADMARLQLDSHSLWAGRYRDRAVAAARRAGEDGLADVLTAWDLSTETDALGPAPYFAWLYRLRALLATDELGEDGTMPDFAFLRLMEEGGEPGTQAERWADDLSTAEVEDLSELEERALVAARPLTNVAWGDVNLEQSEHILGSSWILDMLLGLNVGPFPVRGGPYTVRPVHRSGWSALDSTSWSYPRVNLLGPSQRFVAHMAPGAPAGYFLLPTGQAGNPFDRHYRDMASRWNRPELIGLSPGAWEATPVDLLRLLPGR